MTIMKPCPFCGCHELKTSWEESPLDVTVGAVMVYCSKCYARGPTVEYNPQLQTITGFQLGKAAIEIWNRRSL